MSKTILQLKSDYQAQLREKTAPGSISRITDAGMRDDVANELRDRGVINVADTDALASQSYQNSRTIIIKNKGVFQALETEDSADDKKTFASADDGWLWELVHEFKRGKASFKVGVTDGAPTPGTNTWTLDEFENASVLVLFGEQGIILQLIDNGNGAPWIQKEFESKTLTINNYLWQSGDIIGYMI